MSRALHRALALALLLAGWSAGCSADSPPDVLVVSIDTLRADALGSYGETTPGVSPRLDAFATRATRYTRALAPSPWTLPSHASMFTGLYPAEHGARSDRAPDGRIRVHGLPADPPHLAGILRDSGYETAAFVANTGYLRASLGIARGFGEYVNVRLPAAELNARHVVPWLEARVGVTERPPFFLFVNYMDTHEPYNTRPVPGFDDGLADRDSEALLQAVRPSVMMRQQPAPKEALATLRRQYEVAVANVDRALGDLLGRLEASGALDDMLVVVTSDHGEYFGEHELVTHWKHLYQEVLRVPLLVKRPGQHTGGVEDAPVSLVQLPRLVLDSLPEPLAKAHRARFPRAPGEDSVWSEIHFSSWFVIAVAPWRERLEQQRFALIDWPWKYIRSSGDPDELYHLEADPAEQRSLLDVEPGRARTMRTAIDAYARAARPVGHGATADAPDPETLEELEALGYAVP